MDEQILNNLLKAYSEATAASVALTAQISELSEKKKEIDALLSSVKDSIVEEGEIVKKQISEKENKIISANNSFSSLVDSLEEHLSEEKSLAGKNSKSLEMLRLNIDKRFAAMEERISLLENK